MAALNRVLLIGNAGADPELRYTASGEAVASLRLATTESWKDKASGELREATEWHRLVAYRKVAEVMGEFVKKGKSLYVEGKLKTRKWTDKQGVDRYTTEIEVTDFQLLGSNRSSTTRDSTNPQQPAKDGSDGAGGGNGTAGVAPRGSAFERLGDDKPFAHCSMDDDPVFVKATRQTRRHA